MNNSMLAEKPPPSKFHKKLFLLVLPFCITFFLLAGCGSIGVGTGSTNQQQKSSYALLYTFKPNASAIWSIAWSPNSLNLVFGADIAPLQIWNLASQSRSSNLDGPSGTTDHVSWSPDGQYVAATSLEPKTTLRVWNAATQHLDLAVKPPSIAASVAWSPDSKFLAVSAGGITIDESHKVHDSEIEIYSSSNWQIQVTLPFTNFNEALAWAPDGKQLAFVSASGDMETQALAGWDTAGKTWTEYPEEHTGRISSVRWSPDGRNIATSSDDGTVIIWDPKTKKKVTQLIHGGRVHEVTWSPDGKRLASGGSDMIIKIWDSASGKLLATMSHKNDVDTVAWSPDGKYLASAGHDDTIRIWDVR